MSFAINVWRMRLQKRFCAAAYYIEASENARTDRTENNTVLDEGKFYQSLKKEVH